MSLPDHQKLERLRPGDLRALGRRLDAIGLAEAYETIVKIGSRSFDHAALPLRIWHARRKNDAASHALRMFCFEDAVTEAEATIALGEIPLEPLLEAGLLARDSSGHMVSPYELWCEDGLHLFADRLAHGGDAVMAIGPSTKDLVRAALPKGRVSSALDLGCGAGFCAMLFARRADRVIGTDINARAIALARMNAAINGVDNVEFRQGDLLAPVRDLRFDRIVSQPPFIPHPPELKGATFMYGGRVGDELLIRALGEIPHGLAESGIAVVFAHWPVDERTIEERVGSAIANGPPVDALVLEANGPSIEDWCIGMAAYQHPDFGLEFAREVVMRREHFETIGASAMQIAYVVLHRPKGTSAWSSTVDLAGLDPSASLVENMIRARAVVAGGVEAILHAAVRFPEGVGFVPNGEGVTAEYPEDHPVGSVQLDRGTHQMLALLDASSSVRDAALRIVSEREHDAETVILQVVDVVQRALLAGLLEVRP